MANTHNQGPSGGTEQTPVPNKSDTYSPNKDHVNFPKFDSTNFPLWERKIKMHLRPRQLETYLEEPLPKELDKDELKGALTTCSILREALSKAIFTSVINDNNKQDPFSIWSDIKTIYASDSLLSVFQVWNKCLAEFSSLGLKVPDVLVSCGIFGKITKQRPMLIQVLFTDPKALAKPKEIIAKLCDIGSHETATKRKFFEDPCTSSTALTTGPRHKPKRQAGPSSGAKSIIRCRGGKHNPKATTHFEADCWTIHPTTLPLENPLQQQKRVAAHCWCQQERPQKKQQTSYHTTAGDDDVEEEEEVLHTSIVKPSFAYNTTANSEALTTVLDSGASNHMLKFLEYFLATTPATSALSPEAGNQSSSQ
ncbi:hypothetical protein PTTG_27053 [Puccinia triticina 1-1 BBBD Race 1]|uniref:Uncharacterized protein n=1 Tax=Puccinia triticina (isolate 1-1 / race 1 (BBBD)) TaxID=630390 RepID=A0A180GN04_PUCT1|nr:hypothetical protein PTTG_27053 [Puccinia triticina 1-1 BBBD Race 1]